MTYYAPYDSRRWRRFRLSFLAANPLCVYCKQRGRVTEATIVDHVVPHKGDPVKFWAGPFQALCKPCHDGAKKSEEMTGRRRGCDANGIPLDRNHHWAG